jgi:hypothetical protein
LTQRPLAGLLLFLVDALETPDDPPLQVRADVTAAARAAVTDLLKLVLVVGADRHL